MLLVLQYTTARYYPNYLQNFAHRFFQALFTSRVFSPTRGLGIRGDLVKPLLSPNPRISPDFPSFPNSLGYFEFLGWEGMEGGRERTEASDKKRNFTSTLIANQVKI
jgi:hypothetical protein